MSLSFLREQNMKNKIKSLPIIGMVLTLSVASSSSVESKEFDLGVLGKIVVDSESTVNKPPAGTFSPYTTQSWFSINHELDDVRIPPLTKIAVKGSILENNALASLEVTFEGLLMKGVPEYLSTEKAKNEFKKYDITVEPHPDDNNKVILRKTIPIPEEKRHLVEEFNKINQEIKSYQQQISAARGAVANIATDNFLQKAVAKKNELFSQLIQNIGSFPCGPEFKRVFTFPIWGVGGSVGGENASAEARAGVSGDVQIEIAAPTCGISADSLFQAETWGQTNIDITSSGYFGANAGAQASGGGYGIAFYSEKYGNYSIPIDQIRINDDEKRIFNDLVLKMLKEAENSEQALSALTEKISGTASNITNKIQSELISRLQNPSQICSFLQQVGAASSNSEAARICQTLLHPLLPAPLPPIIPELVPPPMPSLPLRPDGRCRAPLPLLPCRVERVCGVCEHCERIGVGRFSREVCVPVVPCTNCSNQEIPPHCREARRAREATNAEYRRICQRLESWARQVDDLTRRGNEAIARARRQWRKNRDRLTAEYNARMAEYNRQVTQRAEYSRRLTVLAEDAIKNNVLRRVNHRAVAEKLLSAAWKAYDWVNLTNDFITDRLPQNLSFNIKGAAKVAFHSKAHILHATPKLRTVSSYDLQQNSFTVTVYGTEDTRTAGELSGIGGLDVLGYTLSAELKGSFVGRDFNFGSQTTGNILPMIDQKKINFSKEEKRLFQWKP
jgi:hypothetical protein